jgi:hypothetical protein
MLPPPLSDHRQTSASRKALSPTEQLSRIASIPTTAPTPARTAPLEPPPPERAKAASGTQDRLRPGCRRRWGVTLAVVALILAGGAGPSHAESGEALYKRGLEFRRAGKDADALEVFKQLNDLEKSPRSVAQMGLAEQALGLWVEAEGHLTEALKADDNPWIRKNRHALEGALVEINKRLGHVDVWGEPAGAEVLIDGKVVGTLPLAAPVPVVVGNIPIAVRAPGYLERSTVVSVGPNESARERFVLQRAELSSPAVAAAESPRPATAPTSDSAPPSVTVVVSPGGEASAPDRPGTLRAAAKWTAWGVGAVALGVGTFGALGQTSAGNDFNASCGLDSSGKGQPLSGSSKTPTQCQSFQNSAGTDFDLEVVGFVAAGALAVTGLVLWLTEEHHTGARSEALLCAPQYPLGSSLSIGCAVRF